ncbi:MAG: LamG-like jellyroll fold domain-containing protein, partial [Candidatus Desantisbacteria bacterium]
TAGTSDNGTVYGPYEIVTYDDAGNTSTSNFSTGTAYVGMNVSPYWFDETTSGPGANDSVAWEASASFVDTGLTPNTQYTYRVRAQDANSNASNYSSTASKYTLANAPGTASFSNITTSNIRANWTQNSNPGTTQYYCENQTYGSNSGWITTTYWDSGSLSPNAAYTFRVKAKNGDGTETTWTDLGTAYTLPSQPTITSCANQTDVALNSDIGKVIINWSGDATAYTLERDTSSGFSAPTAVFNNQSGNTYTDTTPASNTTYYYRVKGRNPDNNWSTYSATASAVTSDRLKSAVSNLGIAEINCIGYWSFDNSTNMGFDYSMYRHNGAVTGGSSVAGISGNGRSSGTSNYIDCGQVLNTDKTKPFTMETWINISDAASWKTIVGTNTSMAEIAISDTGQARFGQNGGGGWWVNGGAISLNMWHHIVGVYDGTNASIYVDGSLIAGPTANSFTSNHGSTLIGRATTTGTDEWFSGKMDEVRIYNRALTSSEIRSHYTTGFDYTNLSAKATDANLVGCWNFDEGAGGYAYDTIGNQYNGVITDAVWAQGKNGYSLNFTGTNDKVQLDVPLITGSGDFTISAWAYASGSTADADYIAGNYSANNGGGIEFYIYQNKLQLFIGTSVTGTASLSVDTWYHVAVTRIGGGAVKLYLNGVQDGSGTLSNSITGSRNFAIGNGPDYTSEKFEGKIDEVRVYNAGLSPAQVYDLYSSSAPNYTYYRSNTSSGTYEPVTGPVTDGLALCLDADSYASYPGTGTTWYDLSGRGYNAAMRNMTASNWVTVDGIKAFETNDTDNQGFSVANWNQVTERTWEIWVKPKTTSIGWQTWVDNNGSERILFGHPDTTLYVYPDLSVAGKVTANEWAHYAFTMDASKNVRIFKNGQLISTGVYNSVPTLGSQTLYLLGDAGTEISSAYTGLIRLFDRQLSDVEVLAEYNHYAQRFLLEPETDIDTFSGFYDDFSGGSTTVWLRTGTPVFSNGTVALTGADQEMHTARKYGSGVLEICMKSSGTNGVARFGMTDGQFTEYASSSNAVFFNAWSGGLVYEDSFPGGTQAQSGTYSGNQYYYYKIVFVKNSYVEFYQDGVLKKRYNTAPNADMNIWIMSDSTDTQTFDWVRFTPIGADKADSQAPSIPGFSPVDDGSSSHNPSTWQSNISNDNTIDFGWSEPLSNGDDYFYFVKSVDASGNESKMFYDQNEKTLIYNSYWGTPSRTTSEKKNGSYSTYFASPASGDYPGCGVMPMPTMTVGRTYRWSYWAKGGTSTSLAWSVQNGGGDENNMTHSVTLTSDWQKFTHVATLNIVKNSAYMYASGFSKDLYIDDLEIEEVVPVTITAPIAGFWWALNNSSPENNGTWVSRLTVSATSGAAPDAANNYIYVKAEDGAGNLSTA